MSATCYHKNCSRPATHHLGFRAWGLVMTVIGPAIPTRQMSRSAAGILPLPLCKRHAQSAMPEHVFDETTWTMLTNRMTSAGLGVPHPTSVYLHPIKGLPASALPTASSSEPSPGGSEPAVASAGK